ncbi:hypothetical protein O181_032224 [Austropuccinia psidii MF-1]|uniref:Chromo domain-containing protein n=1 Tax=Austropuccinia psidii MF-1 TaxID=1389203 RepID=A0A9Q3CWD8_9BASI|nr:hypothetical protein [Austropuccinia psidii MF-1]
MAKIIPNKGEENIHPSSNFYSFGDSFVGTVTIIRLIDTYAVEVRLTEEFSRKQPMFPVGLLKPYHQTGEDKLPSRNTSHTQQDIVDAEDSLFSVKRIMEARKIRLNGNDQRQYLVIFKNQTADKDKWLAEKAIPDDDHHLRRLRGSRRA